MSIYDSLTSGDMGFLTGVSPVQPSRVDVTPLARLLKAKEDVKATMQKENQAAQDEIDKMKDEILKVKGEPLSVKKLVYEPFLAGESELISGLREGYAASALLSGKVEGYGNLRQRFQMNPVTVAFLAKEQEEVKRASELIKNQETDVAFMGNQPFYDPATRTVLTNQESIQYQLSDPLSRYASNKASVEVQPGTITDTQNLVNKMFEGAGEVRNVDLATGALKNNVSIEKIIADANNPEAAISVLMNSNYSTNEMALKNAAEQIGKTIQGDQVAFAGIQRAFMNEMALEGNKIKEDYVDEKTGRLNEKYINDFNDYFNNYINREFQKRLKINYDPSFKTISSTDVGGAALDYIPFLEQIKQRGTTDRNTYETQDGKKHIGKIRHVYFPDDLWNGKGTTKTVYNEDGDEVREYNPAPVSGFVMMSTGEVNQLPEGSQVINKGGVIFTEDYVFNGANGKMVKGGNGYQQLVDVKFSLGTDVKYSEAHKNWIVSIPFQGDKPVSREQIENTIYQRMTTHSGLSKQLAAAAANENIKLDLSIKSDVADYVLTHYNTEELNTFGLNYDFKKVNLFQDASIGGNVAVNPTYADYFVQHGIIKDLKQDWFGGDEFTVPVYYDINERVNEYVKSPQRKELFDQDVAGRNLNRGTHPLGSMTIPE